MPTTKLKLDSLEWHTSLSLLFEHAGTSDFAKYLIATINKITPYDAIVVYAFENGQKPHLLFHNLPEKWVDITITEYTSGYYLLDPATHACEKGMPSGIYHISELAPDHFKQSEYYKSYYQKIGLHDESVILIMLEPGSYISISTGHRCADLGKISTRDLQRLKKTSPALISASRINWNPAFTTRGNRQAHQSQDYHLAQAFNSFGHRTLTDREQEIVREILKGHSGKSIAQMLNISVETVKVHRKHINNKLGISSHAQLFTKFINHLASLPAAPNNE